MKLIVISPEDGSQELDELPELFENGLEIFHIRKRLFNEEQMKDYLSGISEKYYERLVLHSFYLLAEEFSLKGIHYPEEKRLQTEIYPSSVQISSSFHSLEELKEFKIKFDYVFLSPVFNSISKEGYTSRFNSDELKVVLPLINQKVIALGGVDLNNVIEVRELGFAGVALLGAIWNSGSPLDKFNSIKKIIGE